MEEAVVVLGAASLVVFAAVAVVLGVGVGGVVVEGVGGEGAGFDGGAQGFGAHLAPRGAWLRVHQPVLRVVGADFAVGVVRGVVAEGDALRCGAGCGVGDCEHGYDGADDDGGGAGAARADQGVAVMVVGFHADGRHGEVGAVDGDHGGLGEAGLGVVFLDAWVDGDGGDDEEHEEVDCDGGLIHGAGGGCEEDVHGDCHGKGDGVHAKSGADEDAAPGFGVVILDFLQAEFGPGVGEVDKEDQSQQYEHHSTGECEVFAPHLEEDFGDEEGHHDKGEPGNDFGAPVAVL